jgi:5-methylcytosine-specific restriction endonuclease McrA
MNGGDHGLDNLQPCCAQCNNRKGHKEVAQRNRTISHARAEAMRNHAIPIAKTEKFFYEKENI